MLKTASDRSTSFLSTARAFFVVPMSDGMKTTACSPGGVLTRSERQRVPSWIPICGVG